MRGEGVAKNHTKDCEGFYLGDDVYYFDDLFLRPQYHQFSLQKRLGLISWAPILSGIRSARSTKSPSVILVHVSAAHRRSHQWCASLTPNNTKTIRRMTCHCLLRPVRRDLPRSSYTNHNLRNKLLQDWSIARTHNKCFVEAWKLEDTDRQTALNCSQVDRT